MSSHVIGQVSHHNGSPFGFFNRSTWNLEEVNISVNIHLAVSIINDLVYWHYLTVACIEMEKSLKIVNIWSHHEVWRSHIYSEPVWDWQMFESHKTLGRVFIYLHVHAEICRVKVNHDFLFFKAETLPSCTNDLGNILINSLFDEKIRRVDLINMFLDITKSLNSFL